MHTPRSTAAPTTTTAPSSPPALALLADLARQAVGDGRAQGAVVMLREHSGNAAMRVMAGAGRGAALLGRVAEADGKLDDVALRATVPIDVAGERWGALAVLDGDDATPDGASPAALDDLAALAASVVRGMTERHEATATLDAAVEALAGLLDLRDGYTGQHTDAVMTMCCDIGRHLMLSADAQDELRIAGRLHDLGKIGVPDAILHKPGELSPEEWGVMRRHPEWGAAALGRVAGWEGVAAAVRGHHERWDGHGYPDGLAGEEIPTLARIVAIADAWHAMTSDRSYRRALDLEHAWREIQDGRGTQFDPTVVDALEHVLDRSGRFARDGAATASNGHSVRSAPARDGARALAEAFHHVAKLPVLKEPHERLARLLASGETSDEPLLAIIESDLALTVAVLRAANALGDGGAVTGIPTALRTLTREQLAAVHGDLRPIDYFQRVVGWAQPFEHLRLHAVATQRSTDRLARALDRPDRDDLLVGALLHDIGKLVLETAYRSYPTEIHGNANTPDGRVRAERAALGLDHAAVGGLLLRRWALPGSLAEMVERHHAPDAEGPAAILRLADMLAHYAHARPVDPDLMLQASAAAGLTPQQLRAMMFDLSQAEHASPRATSPSPLTRSERKALQGLSDGKTYKEIAHDLGLSTSTIRSHCHNVYRKLGVVDRSQAVLRAAHNGWI